MAQVLGESGRYVSQEAVKKRRHFVILAFSIAGTLCFVWGVSIGLTLSAFNLPTWTTAITSLIAFLVILGLGDWSLPKPTDKPIVRQFVGRIMT